MNFFFLEASRKTNLNSPNKYKDIFFKCLFYIMTFLRKNKKY